ncbi:2397_t:CDS:2 [Diversispora eburnea]|uniref:2397_t:CDS:1 n=1 Tax=Diversispora eburnea TaxID=1213867 RepID=A0A9N8VD06_9GLOM|nr:2397_t:CDS:2 [Diversispora eburnea]
MEPLLLLACIIICILCFQNIYVQLKRPGSLLIWYSISNSLIALSYVIAGFTLPNDFKVNNASTSQHIWCGLSGLLYSLTSISNAGVALALSIELYVSLRLTNLAVRQNIWIKRLNCSLIFCIPVIAILLSVIILIISHDRIFETADAGGICQVSTHGSEGIALLCLRVLPEYLPIYPSGVLSVLAIIPVAKKVFTSAQLRESISIQLSVRKTKSPPPTLPTRAGPPPNPTSNTKLLPRNVLLRMGLWNTHWPAVEPFLAKNGSTIHMCLNMGLFLLCFGTGEFANEQYRKLWTKIFGKNKEPKKRPNDFSIPSPTHNRISPTISDTITTNTSISSPTRVIFDNSNKYISTSNYYYPQQQYSQCYPPGISVITLDPRYRQTTRKTSLATSITTIEIRNQQQNDLPIEYVMTKNKRNRKSHNSHNTNILSIYEDDENIENNENVKENLIIEVEQAILEELKISIETKITFQT